MIQRLVTLLLCSAALLGAIAFRLGKQAEAHQKASRTPGPPALRVARAAPASRQLDFTLPATVRPIDQVTLMARASGTVRELRADLGDRVRKGDLLARIEAPELLASLAQATARLKQARTTVKLVEGQHERAATLARSGNLSAQDLDSSALRLELSRGEVLLAAAEHERLAALAGYLSVRAPFEGTIQRRLVDEGALASAERTALFELATTARLQIDVEVPQWAAASLRPGLPVKVWVGGQELPAHVARAAGGLDPALRTLRVELLPDAVSPLLAAGAYARAAFSVPRAEAPLRLPGSAVGVRQGATVVAQVGERNTLHFVPVKVVRELGRDVELQGALAAGDRVALYPPASLEEGDAVTPIEPQTGGSGADGRAAH